jgi:hypothetical protein
MAEVDGCVKAAAGPLGAAPIAAAKEPAKEGVQMTIARAGKEAPDFEATAYIQGKGFKNIKLSDYRGKWVVLCFYPGDFTFV